MLPCAAATALDLAPAGSMQLVWHRSQAPIAGQHRQVTPIRIRSRSTVEADAAGAKTCHIGICRPSSLPIEDTIMEPEAFTSVLAKEGFTELVIVTREAGALEEHAHPFEAKALILSGEIHIRIGDDERLYRPGDVFHLPADLPHAERYGPQGVQYLVGRK